MICGRRQLIWLFPFLAWLSQTTQGRLDNGGTSLSDLIKQKTEIVKKPLIVHINGTKFNNHNCTFDIREKSCDGPSVQEARASTKLCFKWTCQSDSYGMRVESCEAASILGTRMLLLNDQGCTADEYFMNTPIYDDYNLSSASAMGNLFIYEQNNQVIYECKIQLCDLCDCASLTPPVDCSDYRKDENHPNVELQRETVNQTFPWCDLLVYSRSTVTSVSLLVFISALLSSLLFI